MLLTLGPATQWSSAALHIPLPNSALSTSAAAQNTTIPIYVDPELEARNQELTDSVEKLSNKPGMMLL